MIGVGFVYVLVGGVFAVIAAIGLADRSDPRRGFKSLFWGLFASSFLFGDRLGDLGNGVLVLGLVLIGGLGGFGKANSSTTSQEVSPGGGSLGVWLFAPVLIVPAVAVTGSLALKWVRIAGAPLVDPNQTTVISLAVGVVAGLLTAVMMLRPPPLAPMREARRLMNAVGWAAILPQLLAALGAVFALAGVGRAVGEAFGHWAPLGTRFAAVATYGVGMAAFTMITGNAFAAFPVMVAAVGAPILIGHFGGDAAAIGAMGMLCGYCGTLLTPMAAHNIVPTALLELPSGAVIRAQAPTALLVLAANVALLNLLAFRS